MHERASIDGGASDLLPYKRRLPRKMNNSQHRLGTKSRTILEMIAGGHSYEQILHCNERLTYLDIFNAADEALKLYARESSDSREKLSEVRKSHPRAYERWTPEEDSQLTEMFNSGTETRRIVGELQRQPSAIRSRLMKLGLLKNERPNKEQPQVVIDPEVLSGKPCIAGTRIPAHDIADMVSNGDTVAAILDAYPSLTEELVRTACAYAQAHPRAIARHEPPWRMAQPYASEEKPFDELTQES